LHLPVYGILCDGEAFEFFKFDGSTKPFSFYLGCDPKDPPARLRAFRLPDLAGILTSRPFIHTLRPICEIIFDLLLQGYISSLKANHDPFVSANTKEGQPRKNWEQAINFAVEALRKFRNAEMQRQNQLIDEANTTVLQAMDSLKLRYDSSTSSHTTSNHLSCNIA
jgi:hypothetical protein